MNQAILRTKSKSKIPRIKGKIKPFGLTTGVLKYEDFINAFLASVLLPLGMSFIPASMIVFTIKERENNAKHL